MHTDGLDGHGSSSIQTYASIWDALEETADAAADMRLRSELAMAIRGIVEHWAVTRTASA
jgi:predicted XRE-type DNA-binding protein